MYEIQTTADFDLWFKSLADMQAKARINARLRRVQLGQLGDVRHVGENVAEFRFFFGSGYRIYFIQHQQTIIVLLVGGDKSTQHKDIAKAKQLAGQLRGEK